MRLFLLCGLFFLLIPANAEIYKWVDAQGQVHYDDKPPVDSQKKLMNINEKSNAVRAISDDRAEKRKKLLEAIEEDRDKKKEKAAEAAKKKQKLTRQCHEAKDQLKNYKSAGYLYDLDKNGNRINFSEEQKKKVITSLEKQISEHCK